MCISYSGTSYNFRISLRKYYDISFKTMPKLNLVLKKRKYHNPFIPVSFTGFYPFSSLEYETWMIYLNKGYKTNA